MAIMNRCCCCDIRTGSIVISIWSMIAGVGSLIQNARAWAALDDFRFDDNHSKFVAFYSVTTILGGMVLLSGICLMFGVMRNSKFLLLPYVCSQCVWILLYFIVMIAIIVLIINGNIIDFSFWNTGAKPSDVTDAQYLSALKIAYGGIAGGMFLTILLDTMCLLCVISFYQELRDGCCTGDRAVLVVNQGGYGNDQYYPTKGTC